MFCIPDGRVQVSVAVEGPRPPRDQPAPWRCYGPMLTHSRSDGDFPIYTARSQSQQQRKLFSLILLTVKMFMCRAGTPLSGFTPESRNKVALHLTLQVEVDALLSCVLQISMYICFTRTDLYLGSVTYD